MPLSPYLSFAGNCADAIAYYQQTLGAELLYKLSFGEMPPSAADNEEGCPSGTAHYSGFTLVLDTQDVAEGKRWFDNLAAQGQIEMDWQETFWAQGFGKVSDRFGVPWMINVVKHQPAT